MQLKMLGRPLALAICMKFASAQQEGIIETLNSVPELSELVTYLTRFPDLTLWLQGLTDVTLLAPNNDAFGALSDSSIGPSLPVDETDAEALIAYHILDGNSMTSATIHTCIFQLHHHPHKLPTLLVVSWSLQEGHHGPTSSPSRLESFRCRKAWMNL